MFKCVKFTVTFTGKFPRYCFTFECIQCVDNRKCEVVIQADEEDTIYRVTTPSISKGGKGQDFIMLASRRQPCDARYSRTCF